MRTSWLLRHNGCGRPANDNASVFVPGFRTVLALVALSLIARLVVTGF
jgi:hypothetical protein